MSTALELAKQLINLPSISPDDGGCQDLIANRLNTMGFTVNAMPFDDVSNLWATLGDSGPMLVLAGHTDVVPTGAPSEWLHPPFTATEDGGFLYGRGAADMKSSLAAMITATERLLSERPLKGRLGFLITSDEEAKAINGTRRVMTEFTKQGISFDYCLVGEPSSTDTLGDTIKIGRRGSLNGKLTVIGVKGHVAYPHLALNPIHKAMPALAELIDVRWDEGNQYFPPTSFQISNIQGGGGANNVLPETLTLDFNLRFSTELTAQRIRDQVESVLNTHGVKFDIEWHLSGEPFITRETDFIDAVSDCINEVQGFHPERSTSGGTSDGRFIAPTGVQVVELGPCNATIHKINERVRISDIDKLEEIYYKILNRLV